MNDKEIKELKRNAEWKGDIEAAKKLANMYRNGTDGVEPSIHEAMKWYTKAAAKGDKSSMEWVGWLYLGNMGHEKDESKAFKWLKKAVNAGEGSSYYWLALCYRNGTGVNVNVAKSVELLEMGVDAQSTNAMYELATMYMDGSNGVEQNDRKAAYYMEMSAKHNMKKGMYYYAEFCFEGRGVEKSNGEALKWWKKSAEEGYADAMYKLGKAYAFWSSDREPDYYHKDGIHWLECAYKQGNIQAACDLGTFYLDKKKDYQMAIKWYKISAEKGNVHAMAGLYGCYLLINDNTEGVKWIKKAADSGFRKARVVMGMIYFEGKLLPPDYEKAKFYLESGYESENIESVRALSRFYEAEYYERGRSQESFDNAIKYLTQWANTNDKDAMYSIGMLYLDKGKDSKENLNEVTFWLKEAAEKEHALAMYHLAYIYLTNYSNNKSLLLQGREWMDRAAENGVDKAIIFAGNMYFDGNYGASVDYSKSLFWSKIAASKYNEPRAYYNIGMIYGLGKNVEIDYNVAFENLTKAAELKCEKAYNNLAYLYKSGNGVKKSYDEAIKWYKKSLEAKYLEGKTAHRIGLTYKQKGDRKNAIEWFTKAIEYGEKDAKKDLDELYESMAGEKTAMEELDSYIGLTKVKQKMKDLEVSIKMKKRRQQLGQELNDSGFMHMVFTGNAGTGKTEVAKLVARVLCEIGVLSNPKPVVVERGDLVGQHIGETEKKTTEVINRALGGVLFIDEAYTLSKPGSGKDYGQEAIDTLLTAMVKHRNDLVVIVAGYTVEMQRFMEANQGLKSRFGEVFEFEDYTADELYAIFERLCQKQGFVIEEEAGRLIKEYLSKQAGNIDFGNARGVGKYFQEIKDRQDVRLSKISDSEMTDEEIKKLYTTFTSEDVMAGTEKKENEISAMDELESYIGLTKVKQKMKELKISIKMRRRRQELGQEVGDSGFLHMAFIGNPGTGKTEVASIVARVLCELGVLTNEKPVVVERGDLVGQYIGETEKKTTSVINRALGGVLFIDEAYTLAKEGGGGKDYGQEAIDTLLTAMVKYRDKLVVIAAGYTKEMERFFESNSGLKSRFGEIVEFEDYTADELFAIFNRLSKKRGFALNEKAEKMVYEYLSKKSGDRDFGNGRGVGRYFQKIVDKQDIRLLTFDDTGLSDEEVKNVFLTLTEEDVAGVNI